MINITSKTDSAPRPEAVPVKAPTPALKGHIGAETDRLSATSQETLQSLLKDLPEVRKEVVDRGHQLAIDANYPPKEIIRRLSDMLISSVDLAQ